MVTRSRAIFRWLSNIIRLSQSLNLPLLWACHFSHNIRCLPFHGEVEIFRGCLVRLGSSAGGPWLVCLLSLLAGPCPLRVVIIRRLLPNIPSRTGHQVWGFCLTLVNMFLKNIHLLSMLVLNRALFFPHVLCILYAPTRNAKSIYIIIITSDINM